MAQREATPRDRHATQGYKYRRPEPEATKVYVVWKQLTVGIHHYPAQIITVTTDKAKADKFKRNPYYYNVTETELA